MKTFADVTAVGKAFLQKKVKTNPWSGSSDALYEETVVPRALRAFMALHDHGILTTNSQPSMKSADVEQKSWVTGFADRRIAPALVAALSKVPGTVAYAHDYKTGRDLGNFRFPTPKQVKARDDEYWVLTRIGARGMKRVDKYNPARAPYSPVTTEFLMKKGVKSDLLHAKCDMVSGPGEREYAGCSRRLYDIMKNESAYLCVYNTEFGAKPEVADKILRILRRLPKTCAASKVLNAASGRCVSRAGRAGTRALTA